MGFSALESSAYKTRLAKLGVDVPLFKDILVLKDLVNTLIKMRKDPLLNPKKRIGLSSVKLDTLQHSLLDYKHVKDKDKLSICCDFFSNEMTTAKEQISKRLYYNKHLMDTYFKGKIKEHNVITDCDIDKVLHKMYLRFGFREYKRNNYEHVFDLLGISAPVCKAIIANEQVLEQLHIFPSAAYLSSSPSI